MCKTDNQPGPSVKHRELYSVFHNNLYGKESEKYVYTHTHTYVLLNHFAIYLKLVCYKSTRSQYKVKIKFKMPILGSMNNSHYFPLPTL